MISIRSKVSLLAILIAAINLNGGGTAFAETAALRPPAILTPDTVDSRVGKLDF
ncbi:hypothetical protein LJR231_006127 [Phyllobacterium sp. LjRoot231]|uniref:hypothetical protein n=1 Tax=Phyllobacterium sp. LjRoot231 TaxID=3342289 RepID=UPI003ECC65F6